MSNFLIGIDKETSINTGAFYLAVVMMVLFSYILLLASQDENVDLFEKNNLDCDSNFPDHLSNLWPDRMDS